MGEVTWADAWEHPPGTRSAVPSRVVGVVAVQPLSLPSLQGRAPRAKAEGDHPCRALLWACFIPPDVHCGDVVTCEEAREKGKPPLTFSCLSLSLRTKPSEVWSVAPCEFFFLPSSAPATGVSPKALGLPVGPSLAVASVEGCTGICLCQPGASPVSGAPG